MSFNAYIDKENLVNSPGQLGPRSPTKFRADSPPKKRLFFSPSNTGLSPLLPSKRRVLSPRIKSPVAQSPALSPSKLYRSTTPLKRTLELDLHIKDAELLKEEEEDYNVTLDFQCESTSNITDYPYESLYDRYGFLVSDQRCTEPS